MLEISVLHVDLLFIEKTPSFVFIIERDLLVYHHSLYFSKCNYVHAFVFCICFKSACIPINQRIDEIPPPAALSSN